MLSNMWTCAPFVKEIEDQRTKRMAKCRVCQCPRAWTQHGLHYRTPGDWKRAWCRHGRRGQNVQYGALDSHQYNGHSPTGCTIISGQNLCPTRHAWRYHLRQRFSVHKCFLEKPPKVAWDKPEYEHSFSSSERWTDRTDEWNTWGHA